MEGFEAMEQETTGSGRCCDARATEVYWLCQSLARVLGRRWIDTLEGIGLTATQLEVLQVLWRQDGIPLHEIGKALCCVNSNVTGLIDRMERDGLVVRSRKSKDRRVVTVWLTERGRELQEQVASLPPCCFELLTVLAEEEIQLLLHLLNKTLSGLLAEGQCSLGSR